MLSKRINSISPSITLAISAKAKKMKKQGIDVVGFGAGEPDFDTPQFIKDEAIKAIQEGFTKYTPASGIIELKDAIIEKFKKDNNLNYCIDEVLISCGAKHSVFNAITALCDEDDEVILPVPYWVSYPEMIKATGAKIIYLKTLKENDFKIKPQELKKTVTKKTKLFILNSPSNPTGTVYTETELKEIAEILVKYNIYCVSDEIYEKIIYDNTKHISIASLGKEIKNLTIVINGVSKTYSMTGWRIGYAAGNKDIIKAMSNLQSHSTSNPTSISQKASVVAIKQGENFIKEMVEEFKRRRTFVTEKIKSIQGISSNNPAGAFYVFINISEIIGRKFNNREIKGSMDFAVLLLDEEKVAVVPGIAFGDDSYIRISYATSLENLEKGFDRIEKFIKKLN